MSYLNTDGNLRVFEAGTFEGLSQLDLLGAVLVELRVVSTYLHMISESVDTPEDIRKDVLADLTA